MQRKSRGKTGSKAGIYSQGVNDYRWILLINEQRLAREITWVIYLDASERSEQAHGDDRWVELGQLLVRFTGRLFIVLQKEGTGGSPMLKIFKKRRSIFIKLIQQQAALTLEGLELLASFVSSQDPKTADLLTLKEKEADEARRILINELNRTFITPFDREDIFALSRAIDDVLDYAYSTMTEIMIFKVTPTVYMERMVNLLRDSTYELYQAVERFQDHPAVSSEHASRAKALENQVEEVYREALRDLFHETDDVKQLVTMLKMREVYRHLSNAADRGDEAANVIADIVVKMT